MVDDPVIILDEDGYESGIIAHSLYTGEMYNVNNELTALTDSLDSSWFPNEGE